MAGIRLWPCVATCVSSCLQNYGPVAPAHVCFQVCLAAVVLEEVASAVVIRLMQPALTTFLHIRCCFSSFLGVLESFLF